MKFSHKKNCDKELQYREQLKAEIYIWNIYRDGSLNTDIVEV
jgi:hypothetical protein